MGVFREVLKKFFLLVAIVLLVGGGFTIYQIICTDSGGFIKVSPTSVYKKEVLKIKGFYLGMDIYDALNNFPVDIKERFDAVVETSIVGNLFILTPFSNINVIADKEGKVTKFVFSGMVMDLLFNTEGMPIETFLNKFQEKYLISREGVTRSLYVSPEGAVGVKYVSTKEGFKIIIFEDKTFLFQKISKDSEVKFD